MSAPAVFGHTVEVADIRFCEMGGDHAQLVRDIRAERERQKFNVDESSALCLRCGKVIPLV